MIEYASRGLIHRGCASGPSGDPLAESRLRDRDRDPHSTSQLPTWQPPCRRQVKPRQSAARYQRQDGRLVRLRSACSRHFVRV